VNGVNVPVIKNALLDVLQSEDSDSEFPATVKVEGDDFFTYLG
jgi:hypothetical protein